MFRKSVDSETSQNDERPRVYVTSLKNITASSPAKTTWSSHPPASPPSPARKVLNKWSKYLRRNGSTTYDEPIDKPIILSDSISGSNRLQNSIMVLTHDESRDEHEVHCCKQDEANEVIRSLQKKAETQIDEGKLHDALLHLNSALSIQQKLYGKKHATASTLNTIGQVLSNMGEDYRYMAMSALEESLAIRQELEPGSENTANTLNNLWLLFHESNIAISSADKGETITFQDF